MRSRQDVLRDAKIGIVEAIDTPRGLSPQGPPASPQAVGRQGVAKNGLARKPDILSLKST